MKSVPRKSVPSQFKDRLPGSTSSLRGLSLLFFFKNITRLLVGSICPV